MRRQTILLVEDNEDNRAVYSLFLRYHGYTVVEAHDGRQALRLAETVLPDLVLMDVSIPVIDGWEATRRLKASAATAAIPVIAVTAHADPEYRERATLAGCDAYVAKPCEPSRLLGIVREYLGAVPA
jgi:two-component system cell cycle response regulator DivK